jgi:hypothetical protein
MPYSPLQQSVERTALAMCEGLASPVSLGVYLRIKHGEWDDLASMRVDPKHYLDASAYARDTQCVSFLRKYQELPTTVDREAVALENFWLSERQCFRSNERLHPYVEGFSHPDTSEALRNFVLRVRKNVAVLLGPCPDVLDGRFGPGATFGDRGRLTTVPDKMTERPTLTPSTIPFLFQWSGTAWATACVEGNRDPEFVRGNRFTTVPKDCTKHRGIAIEPSINLFYQLAYGRVMKKRLAAAGLNLLEAQSIHKRVACEASIKGHFATIDLSNASDTVCTNLVRLVLPSMWFEALNSLRSPTTLVKGKTVHLEKFSSMGNGFTFELETTIFAAIVMACMEVHGIDPLPGGNLFVFGDDILCLTETFPTVIAALKFLGFTPNQKKTFSEGPFRESCGGDYFNGVDVRPYFLEEEPREPQQYISMANGIRRVGLQDPLDSSRSSALRKAWWTVLDCLPSHIRRLRGPKELGDLVVHDDQSRFQYRWRHSIRYVQVYRPARFRRVGWENWRPHVVLASALYGVGDTLIGPPGKRVSVGVTPRDSVTGYKVGWVPFS